MLLEYLLCVFSFLFLVILLSSSRKNKNAPPGPYQWPFIGNIPEMVMANAKFPHLAFAKLSEKYGEIMSVGFGVHQAVVLSSYEAMKEVLPKSEACMVRYSFPFVKDRSFGKELGVIWATGQAGKEMRRYSIRSLREFGLGKTNSMESIIETELDHFIPNVRANLKADGVFKVDAHFLNASIVNVIWSIVGGHRFPAGDKKIAATIRLNESVIKAVGNDNVYTAFPYLKKWFPKWSQYERHMEVHKEIQDFMKEMIDLNRKDMHDGNDSRNFIEAFLKQIERNRGDPQTNYTEEQLIVILMDLFLAGSETMSTFINWAILYLSLNPRVQRKLQQEIHQIRGSDTNKYLALSEVPSMVYTRATLYEVFRMANLVPLPGPRGTTGEIHYKNYVIPEGICLFFNFEHVFHDKKFWGDPEVFRPERFLDETESKLVTTVTERIIPYGLGNRACLGEALSWDTLFKYVTTICLNFNLEAIPGQEPSPEDPINMATLLPRPYSVKVIPRNV